MGTRRAHENAPPPAPGCWCTWLDAWRTYGQHRERVVHEQERGDAAVHARDLYHAHRRTQHALTGAPVALERGAAQAQRPQARYQVVRKLGALPKVGYDWRNLLLLRSSQCLVDGLLTHPATRSEGASALGVSRCKRFARQRVSGNLHTQRSGAP